MDFFFWKIPGNLYLFWTIFLVFEKSGNLYSFSFGFFRNEFGNLYFLFLKINLEIWNCFKKKYGFKLFVFGNLGLFFEKSGNLDLFWKNGFCGMLCNFADHGGGIAETCKRIQIKLVDSMGLAAALPPPNLSYVCLGCLLDVHIACNATLVRC